jgi:hypothetical protein
MSSPDFQHLRLSRVKDIAVVEIRTGDLQGPMLAQELGTELGECEGVRNHYCLSVPDPFSSILTGACRRTTWQSR